MRDCSTCRYVDLLNDEPRVWGCEALAEYALPNCIVDFAKPPCGGELWQPCGDDDDGGN